MGYASFMLWQLLHNFVNTCGLRNIPPSRVTVEYFKKEHELVGPQFLDGLLNDGLLFIDGDCVHVTEKGEEVYRQYQKAVQEREAQINIAERACAMTELVLPPYDKTLAEAGALVCWDNGDGPLRYVGPTTDQSCCGCFLWIGGRHNGKYAAYKAADLRMASQPFRANGWYWVRKSGCFSSAMCC